ncbi:MAG TPA: glycosyl hydrolase family 18 protein [Anaerolineales bacterium]|nr:glycosyl hydrolase family 18 protein [Anaerolineales bacterium]
MNNVPGQPQSATPSSEAKSFRVIAYVMDPAVPSQIPYDKLTHINYAFLTPNPDGTFNDLNNAWKIGEIVDLAHASRVKVLISVGGWGWDKQFEAMAAGAGTRTLFVQNLVKIVDQYKFDGVDMDWEYPEAGQSSQNFLALMQQLRAALPQGKLLTAAVVALGQHAAGIPDEAFPLMDFVNIMAYDNEGAQHSSLDYAKSALDYWLGRGLPPDKLNLGVPFYARPSEIPYSRIVQDDPAAAQLDSTTYAGILINYNGIPTIQAKTRMAMQRASGIMFWRLENDASGDLSLLTAIHQVVLAGGK